MRPSAQLQVLLMTTALSAFSALSALAGDAAVAWRSDYQEARKQAEESERPILLYFTASWCGPCRQMKQTTFKDEALIGKLNQEWVPVLIDIDAKKALAASRRIRAVPTFVILHPGGSEAGRRSGFMGAPDLAQWLDQWDPETLRAEHQARSRLHELSLEKEFIKADGKTRRDTLAFLARSAASIAQQDSSLAMQFLSLLARDHSSLLVPFLNDPDLLIRVAVEQAFDRADIQLGDYDPWDDKAKRQATVNQLASQLSRN